MKGYIGRITFGVIALLLVIAVFGAFFEVNEGESAIVQRFGEIVSVYVKEDTYELREQLQNPRYRDVTIHPGTGLRFKIPFIDTVTKYSSKLTTYDTLERPVITSNKKQLIFNNNAQWRIVNPVLFYTNVKNEATAAGRIDSIVYARMNDKVGKMESHVLIADKEAVAKMLDELTQEVTLQSKEFGVEVFDIRIKRTDLPQENSESIYERMRTERARIAQQYRSEGDEEAIKIRSETDRQATVITSDALRQSEILKGQADAEAARIYNEAYGRDPEFFKFYNMLLTYRDTIGKSTTLIIPSNSEFAKYLMGE